MGGCSRRGWSMMIRTRRSVLLISLLCVAAIGTPPGTVAGEPHGRLGVGLHAVAAGRGPDRSIVSRTRDGQREVAVSVELAGEPDGVIRGRLRSAGLDLRGTWRRTIEGYVRPRQLEKLAGTPGVVVVRAIRAPLMEAFIGPAPALHGATAWHQTGFTGKGVKIGILDGGFDGFVARLGSELPASVQALCFPDLGGSSPNLADCAGSTHGTAVAEIDRGHGPERGAVRLERLVAGGFGGGDRVDDRQRRPGHQLLDGVNVPDGDGRRNQPLLQLGLRPPGCRGGCRRPVRRIRGQLRRHVLGWAINRRGPRRLGRVRAGHGRQQPATGGRAGGVRQPPLGRPCLRLRRGAVEGRDPGRRLRGGPGRDGRRGRVLRLPGACLGHLRPRHRPLRRAGSAAPSPDASMGPDRCSCTRRLARWGHRPTRATPAW